MLNDCQLSSQQFECVNSEPVCLQLLESGGSPILAVKAARRSEWFGPTLSSEDGRTRFEIEPPAPRVRQLRAW